MSDKLISADALREEMNEYILPLTTNNLMGAADVFHRTAHLLDEAPAVDAVAVDKVAQMFFDFTGDDCPCNFVDVDEWLPEVCELQEECPHPADRLGCWKQFAKHYSERREEKE